MAINIRVEAKRYGHHPSDGFRAMRAAFRKQVDDAGILVEYKEKQYFESPGEKRRRKRKESRQKRRKEENKLKYT